MHQMKPNQIAKERVLFICIHNSARSVMAEAFLNHYCPDFFQAESAGLEPGKLNPLVVEVMQEVGLDIRDKKPRSAVDLFMSGRLFSTVITVCDPASAERCPDFRRGFAAAPLELPGSCHISRNAAGAAGTNAAGKGSDRGENSGLVRGSLPAACCLVQRNFETTILPMKPTILILCTGNSCRSHLAEGILQAAAGDTLNVQSAGSKPAGYVHPLAIQVMKEIGIDISHHHSKHMNDFLNQPVETVITVCGNADQACPMFPVR